MSPDERYQHLGGEIPPTPSVPPNLSYVNWKQSGNTIWLAGHAPNRLKKPPEFDFVGQIGRDLTVEQGYKAARLVGLCLLATLRHALGTLNHVEQILQVIGAINSASGFTEQSRVLNGCTDLFTEIFELAGKPARMVFGCSQMPFNMAMEINMVVQVKDNTMSENQNG